jgi:16S rRNA U1498 N3-methylase RsmE
MQGELEFLRNEEKTLLQDIKKTQKNYAEAKEISEKNLEDNTKEIARLKKLLNEAQTDLDLNLNYLAQEKSGDEDC